MSKAERSNYTNYDDPFRTSEHGASSARALYLSMIWYQFERSFKTDQWFSEGFERSKKHFLNVTRIVTLLVGKTVSLEVIYLSLVPIMRP